MSKPERAARLRSILNEGFPDADVTDFNALIPTMPNHPHDRHVSAVAVKSRASIIVTANTRHFSKLPPGVVAMKPDVFMTRIFESDPDGVTDVLRAQVRDCTDPPISLDHLLTELDINAPGFAKAIRAHVARSKKK
ncbi:hypothetical protein K8I61_11825 [bacterium]|nr:hypothetical protein [bacterium]